MLLELGRRADPSPVWEWTRQSLVLAVPGSWEWGGGLGRTVLGRGAGLLGEPTHPLHPRHGDFTWAVGPGAVQEARGPRGLDSGGRLSWGQL